MQAEIQRREYAFEFTGNGGEYFRIWIVNLLLTVLTLGIYSAWAKVRRLQYFYRNTRLAGAGFEYHGKPLAILKGRLIGAALFLLYALAGKASPVAAVVVALLLFLVSPWLIVRSLRFKLYNSSYRGLRFAFDGTDRGAYRVFVMYPILAAMTLYLLAPLAHQRYKAYQHGNSRFGTTPFRFDAPVSRFYTIYAIAAGIVIVLGILAAIFTASRMPFLLLLLPVGALYVFSYVSVNLANLAWNATTLGEHRLFCRLQAGRFLWIALTNLLGIALTLGLFIPFAQVRMMRYRLEHMGLDAQADLAEFVAGQEQTIGATGEETAEMFDVDLSL